MEFFPEPCTKCICREGFSGEIEAPFCKEIQCLADITYYIHLKRKCAPIYLKDQCCPELFTCRKFGYLPPCDIVLNFSTFLAHPTDKIITHQDDAYHMLPTSSDSESNFGSGLLYDYTDLVNMCVYGDDVLEIGDEVIVSSVVNARCTCITPPVLTCLAV